MQTFKTYEEIMQHYWGKIVPMAKSEGIYPWKFVRLCNNAMTCHPEFGGPVEDYTFATAILEGKPVFVGDKLWSLLTDSWYVVSELSIACLMKNYTWTPPAKKRTFMINGQEYSSPINDTNGCRLDFLGVDYYFETVRERNDVASAINNLLFDAKNKE